MTKEEHVELPGTSYNYHQKYVYIETTNSCQGIVVNGCSLFLSGKSLTVVNGKRWQQMRKILTPAFHADILRPYVKLFQESTNTLLVSNSLQGNFLFDVRLWGKGEG